MSQLLLPRSAEVIETTFRPDAGIVLFCGDVNEFVTQIPDNSVALVVTSPPYKPGKEYENRASIEQYLQTQAGFSPGRATNKKAGVSKRMADAGLFVFCDLYSAIRATRRATGGGRPCGRPHCHR